MKPTSFDLPYGPISAAIRVLVLPITVATFICMAGYDAWHVSTQKRADFTFQDSDIANRKAQFADSVYIARGSAGPYKMGPGVTGVVGGGIRLQVKDQSVECPPVPGSHYDACSFINKDDKAYIMVLLFKDSAAIAQTN